MNKRPDQERPGESVDVAEQETASPPTLIQQFERTFAGGIVRSDSAHHPVFDKFEPQHVTQLLEIQSKTDSDERNFRRGNRWFTLVFVLLCMGIFVFLTVILVPGRSDLYIELLKAALAFVGGMGAGYGIKTYRDRRESE